VSRANQDSFDSFYFDFVGSDDLRQLKDADANIRTALYPTMALAALEWLLFVVSTIALGMTC
jgi:hypothetical protein